MTAAKHSGSRKGAMEPEKTPILTLINQRLQYHMVERFHSSLPASHTSHRTRPSSLKSTLRSAIIVRYLWTDKKPRSFACSTADERYVESVSSQYEWSPAFVTGQIPTPCTFPPFSGVYRRLIISSISHKHLSDYSSTHLERRDELVFLLHTFSLNCTLWGRNALH